MADTRYGYRRIAKCGLCFNLLENPKTLLCSHSFCLHCLSRYINHIRQQNVNATSFPCPGCNTIIKAPGLHVSDWADLLPTNKVLEVVVSALKKSNVEKILREFPIRILSITTVRDTCNRFRRKTPAYIWCMDCSRFICKKCKTQHDALSPDHDTLEVDDTTDDTRLFVSKQQDVCQRHKMELKLYCKDHGIVVCADCVATSHNGCEDVAAILDIIKSLTSPYSQLADAAKTLNEIGDEISYNLQMAFDKKTRKQRIKSDLLKLRSEINKRLDAIQKSIDSSLDQEFTEYLEENSSLTSELEILQGELSDTYHMITATLNYGTNSDKLLCLQELAADNKILKYKEKFHNIWQKLPTIEVAFPSSITETQVALCENLFAGTHVNKLQNFQKVEFTEVLYDGEEETDYCWDSTLATFVIKLDYRTATCCWSTRSDVTDVEDITKLRANLVRNKHHSSHDPIESMPLSVLLDRQQTLVAFGYEAEEMYSSELEAGRQDEWHYFHRVNFFTDSKILKKDGNVTDACGCQLSSLLVLSVVMGYLKDKFITDCKERMSFDPTTNRGTSMSWVVVLPSNTQDLHKNVVLDAALKVGFSSNKIAVITESEASFLACSYGIVKGFDVTGPKANVLVLNCKARSLDISVISYDSKSNYTVLSKSHVGSYCGGDMVNEAFKQLLIKIVGAPVFSDFQTTYEYDYHTLMNEIDVKKRVLKNQISKWVTIKIPITLIEVFESETGEDFRETVLQTEFACRLQLIRGKFRFDKDVFFRLFSLSFENITAEAQYHLDEHKLSVTTVVACGEFALCPLLQQHLMTYFSSMKIILPTDLSLDTSTLKGAVILGFSQLNIISSSKIVGVKTLKAFERSSPIDKKIMTDTASFCQDVFTIIAKDGYRMLNKFVPLDEKQKKMEFFIYVSTKNEVEFVDDCSVSYIGSIVVDIPLNTEVKVETTFLNCEVVITLTNPQNGVCQKMSFDV